jgi:hypothetical protein
VEWLIKPKEKQKTHKSWKVHVPECSLEIQIAGMSEQCYQGTAMEKTNTNHLPPLRHPAQGLDWLGRWRKRTRESTSK